MRVACLYKVDGLIMFFRTHVSPPVPPADSLLRLPPQVFLIFVPDTIRKQYEQKMLRQVEQVFA